MHKIIILTTFLVVYTLAEPLFHKDKYVKHYSKAIHHQPYDVVPVSKPVVVREPQVIYRPRVTYQTHYVKVPRPTPPPPILVHKPVVKHTQEWKLVPKTHVEYVPHLVQQGYHGYGHYPSPSYGYGGLHGFGGHQVLGGHNGYGYTPFTSKYKAPIKAKGKY